jgi:hypothetical protein
MSRTAQLVFLVFYIASAYATGQERTTLVASQVQHLAGPAGQSPCLDAGSTYFSSDLPNFRHAKPRTICAMEIGRNVTSVSLPHTNESVWPIQIHSLKSLHSIEPLLGRAPPSES